MLQKPTPDIGVIKLIGVADIKMGQRFRVTVGVVSDDELGARLASRCHLQEDWHHVSAGVLVAYPPIQINDAIAPKRGVGPDLIDQNCPISWTFRQAEKDICTPAP